MTGGRGCWAKDYVIFKNDFGEKFHLILKSWFYYKKFSFVIRKLSRSSNCTWLQDVHVCAPNQKRTLHKYLHTASNVTIVCIVIMYMTDGYENFCT